MNDEDRKWLNVDRFDTLLPKRKNGRWHPIRTDTEYPPGRNPEGGTIRHESNANEKTATIDKEVIASSALSTGADTKGSNHSEGAASGEGGDSCGTTCASPDARSIPYGGALGGGTAAAGGGTAAAQGSSAEGTSSSGTDGNATSTTETEKLKSTNGNGGGSNDAQKADPALKSVELIPKKPPTPVFNKCEVEIILKGVSSLKQFDCLLFQNWYSSHMSLYEVSPTGRRHWLYSRNLVKNPLYENAQQSWFAVYKADMNQTSPSLQSSVTPSSYLSSGSYMAKINGNNDDDHGPTYRGPTYKMIAVLEQESPMWRNCSIRSAQAFKFEQEQAREGNSNPQAGSDGTVDLRTFPMEFLSCTKRQSDRYSRNRILEFLQ